MRSSQPYIFLLTAFLAVNCGLYASADPGQYARKADSLAIAGDHYTASLYYQKAAFFEENPGRKATFSIMAAENLADLRQYHEAIELLNSINTAGFPDSLTFRVKYTAGLLAYLNADFGLTQNFLIQARYLLSDSFLIYETYLLEALSLNEQFRWTEAQQLLLSLNNYINRKDDNLRVTNSAEINGLYFTRYLPSVRNGKKALKMSTFLPGLGQTYAGYPAEGLLSFCSITVTSAISLYGILNQYYFTSFMLGNYMIGKFYQGGLARTEYLVDKRNYLLTNDFNKKLKNRLLTLFPLRN